MLLSVVGCTGEIGAQRGSGEQSGASGDDPRSPSSNGDPDAPSNVPNLPNSRTQPVCVPGSPLDTASSSLRRLTRLEYDNAVRDLLGDTQRIGATFIADERVAGYATNSIAPISKEHIKQYFQAAETLAETFVTNRLDSALSCDVTALDCVRPFIQRLGRRAFRRPLTPEQLDALVGLYQGTTEGPQTGMALVVQAILSSPQFIYHTELLDQNPAAEGVIELNPFELAARLSFFLWHSVPDDALLDLAQSGELAKPEVIETQVERMLSDSRADAALDAFYAQWLEIEELESKPKSADLFPEWSEGLARAMQQETLEFARRVTQEDGTLETLLTAQRSVLDRSMAAFYGVNAPGSDWQWVDFGDGPRAGLLTHASILASHSHANQTSWVERGLFIRQKFMCESLPSPPADVTFGDTNSPGRIENPQCSGCHELMDPLGAGFDDFDPIGQFTNPPAGENATGRIAGISDLTGTFNSVVDLADKLAQSETVRRCVARQYFRFAYRRLESERDGCTLASIDAAFADGNLRGLLKAVATAASFRYRRTTE